MTMSDGDSDGGETTLGSPGSPPESLSPCFWTDSNAQNGYVVGRPRAEEQEEDCWRLARLSDVCASLETAAFLSPPIARGSGILTAPIIAGTAGKPTERKTLLLSPASQLDVLSQISEMAERDLREAVPAPAKAGAIPPAEGRPHVWATAQRRRKKRATPTTEADDKKAVEDGGSLVALLVAGTKKRRTTHAPQHSDKLEADMLDWETCSEDLFLGHDDASDDAWEFEDVSDSDFE